MVMKINRQLKLQHKRELKSKTLGAEHQDRFLWDQDQDEGKNEQVWVEWQTTRRLFPWTYCRKDVHSSMHAVRVVCLWWLTAFFLLYSSSGLQKWTDSRAKAEKRLFVQIRYLFSWCSTFQSLQDEGYSWSSSSFLFLVLQFFRRSCCVLHTDVMLFLSCLALYIPCCGRWCASFSSFQRLNGRHDSLVKTSRTRWS